MTLVIVICSVLNISPWDYLVFFFAIYISNNNLTL